MNKNVNLSINSSNLSNKSTVISSENNLNRNKFKLPKIDINKDKNIGNNNDDKKSEYNLIKKIGQGTFGKVYLSKIVQNNIETFVAIKKIYNDNNFNNREIKILFYYNYIMTDETDIDESDEFSFNNLDTNIQNLKEKINNSNTERKITFYEKLLNILARLFGKVY